MFIIFAVCLAMCMTMVIQTSRAIHSRVVYHLPLYTRLRLSAPSQHLLKEYYALPEDHRPDVDMHAMLQALDTKHQDKSVNGHFVRWGGESTYFTWDCNLSWQQRDECEYRDYHNMHKEMAGIQKDLKDREHTLAMARAEHELGQVEEFTERLRSERELIQEVTKELT